MGKRKQGFGSAVAEMDQEELPNMPALPESTKAAKVVLRLCDKLNETTEKLEAELTTAKEKLLAKMIEEDVDHVEVNGVPFKRVHTDAFDEVRILKPKKQKAKKQTRDEDED